MSRIRNRHPEDIKAEVRKRGVTLVDIALSAGLSAVATSSALRKPYPAAQKAIADFLGQPVHAIWPEWYDKEGQRIGLLRSVRNPSPYAKPCHRKKSTSELAAGSGSEESPHHPDRSARQARGEGVAVFPAATPASAGSLNEASHA